MISPEKLSAMLVSVAACVDGLNREHPETARRLLALMFRAQAFTGALSRELDEGPLRGYDGIDPQDLPPETQARAAACIVRAALDELASQGVTFADLAALAKHFDLEDLLLTMIRRGRK